MAESGDLRALFDELVELEGEARASRLADLRARDAQLGRQLADLLASDTDLTEPLQRAFAPEQLADFLSAGGPPDELSGRELGPFRLERLLGAGGMGAVYLARQESPDRAVAVKVLPLALSTAARRARFEAEIQTLSSLVHPGIARLYQAGVAPIGSGRDALSLPYFAMEYVEGARDLVQFAQPLPLEQRLHLFCDVVDAIEFAHRKGVIHRDLKPQNILVDPTGRAVVIDFGIARVLDSGAGATVSGQVLGSLASMAPEQLEGDPLAIDARVDVYGLGCVLYELVCGKAVFDASSTSPLDLARRIRELDPPQPSSLAPLPRELDWICATALEKDPAQRYPSARDLGRDVRRLLAGEPVEAAPPSALYRLRKRIARNRLASALAGLALLALMIGAIATAGGLVRALRAERLAGDRLAEARVEASNSQQLNDFLERLLTAANPTGEGRDARVIDLLDTAALELEGLSDQPELERSQRNVLSRAYSALGEFELSLQHAERAAELARADPSANAARDLARALNGIAEANSDLEQAGPAMQAADELEQLSERPVEGLSAWRTEAVIARVRAHLIAGQPERAAEVLEANEALIRGREAVDDMTPGLFENLMTNARVGEKRYAEALVHARACLDTRESELAPDDPRTLAAVSMLLSAELGTGEPGPGLQLALDRLPRWREAYGPQHPNLLHLATTLGEALFTAGQTEQAKQLLSESADLAHAHLPLRVRLLNNLAGMHMRTGDPDAAEPIMQLALETAESVPDLLLERAPTVLLNYYGMCARRADRAELTVELGQRILELESARPEPRTALLRGVRRTLATRLALLDRTAEAEGLWKHLLDRREYEDSPEVEAGMALEFAECLSAQDRVSEARELLEHWIELLGSQSLDPGVLEPLRERLTRPQ